MKMIFRVSFLLFVFFIAKSSNAQTEIGKTEILVLGTYHLNQISNFNPKMLDNLIAKLDSMKFDAICIENMPAQLLYDIQSRNDSAYAGLLEGFGGDRLSLAKSAQEHFNIGLLDAQNEINKILQKSSCSEEERKLLIQYFVASADLASAVLQYEYLQRNNKAPETLGFNGQIIGQLEKLSKSANEIYALAVRLALNQNIQKLEYIDNFQDEVMLLKYFPGFIQDYRDNQDQLKDVGNRPVFQKVGNLIKSGVQAYDLLDLYIFINSKEYQEQDFEAQWAIWFTTNFPSGSDRARYSLWEMRNLQIAANILETAAFYPGKRILVIIGSSHKSFLEKYLRQVPDIELLGFK